MMAAHRRDHGRRPAASATAALEGLREEVARLQRVHRLREDRAELAGSPRVLAWSSTSSGSGSGRTLPYTRWSRARDVPRDPTTRRPDARIATGAEPDGLRGAREARHRPRSRASSRASRPPTTWSTSSRAPASTAAGAAARCALARPGVDTRVLDLAAGHRRPHDGDGAHRQARRDRRHRLRARDARGRRAQGRRVRRPDEDHASRSRTRRTWPSSPDGVVRRRDRRLRRAQPARPRAPTSARCSACSSPKGRYVILEFTRPPFAPVRGVYHWYLRHGRPGARRRGHGRPRRVPVPQRLDPPVPRSGGARRGAARRPGSPT